MQWTAELRRRAQTVERIIFDNPGLSAVDIGRRMGDVQARMVRECVAILRSDRKPISIGTNGQGYVHLDSLKDSMLRAELVKAHYARTRSFCIDHAVLMRAISGMTRDQIAQGLLFDLVIPEEEGEEPRQSPLTIEDLAQLPAARRAGITRLVCDFLGAIEADPEAWAAERHYISDKHGGVFVSKVEADRIREAKRILEGVAV